MLDRSVRTFRNGTVLVGGHPGRLVTLTADGGPPCPHCWPGNRPRPAPGGSAAGWSMPGWPIPGRRRCRPTGDDTPGRGVGLTVVVPVHNAGSSLDRCLGSLGAGVAVVVVDDASDDPDAVARVCRRHGARLVRRATNGGPAAARNEALEVVGTDLVAFVDSDCRVTDGWLARLVWMFDDPDLGAIAPRVRPDRSGADGRPARADTVCGGALRPGHGTGAGRGRPGQGGPLRAHRGPGGPAGGAGHGLRPRAPGGRGRGPGVAPRRPRLARPVRAGGDRVPRGAPDVATDARPALPVRHVGGSAVEAAPGPAGPGGAPSLADGRRRCRPDRPATYRRRGGVGIGRPPGPARPSPRHPPVADRPLECGGDGVDRGGSGPGRHHAGRARPGRGPAPRAAGWRPCWSWSRRRSIGGGGVPTSIRSDGRWPPSPTTWPTGQVYGQGACAGGRSGRWSPPSPWGLDPGAVAPGGPRRRVVAGLRWTRPISSPSKMANPPRRRWQTGPESGSPCNTWWSVTTCAGGKAGRSDH